MDGGGTGFHVHDGVGPARNGGGRNASVWFLSVALIGLSSVLSLRITRTAGPGIEPPRSSVLQAISQRPALAFGFRNVLADVAWLQAVQVAGDRKMHARDYDQLVELLQTVIRFDPHFIVPYLLGGIVLADSPGHVPAALGILEKGESEFPGEWRIPFYAGYIHYFSLGNAAEGGSALLRASRIAGSPRYFPLLAARMLSEGNRPETALAFLHEMVKDETDPLRRRSLEERIRQVALERDIQFLEKAVADFKASKGALPGELADLVRSGVVGRIPEEPNGGAYVLMPDGTVRSDRAVAVRLKVLRRP